MLRHDAVTRCVAVAVLVVVFSAWCSRGGVVVLMWSWWRARDGVLLVVCSYCVLCSWWCARARGILMVLWSWCCARAGLVLVVSSWWCGRGGVRVLGSWVTVDCNKMLTVINLTLSFTILFLMSSVQKICMSSYRSSSNS